jgi:hypothetical protein
MPVVPTVSATVLFEHYVTFESDAAMPFIGFDDAESKTDRYFFCCVLLCFVCEQLNIFVVFLQVYVRHAMQSRNVTLKRPISS